MRLIEEKTLDFIPAKARLKASEMLSTCLSELDADGLYKLSVFKTDEVKEIGEFTLGEENAFELKKRRLCSQV